VGIGSLGVKDLVNNSVAAQSWLWSRERMFVIPMLDVASLRARIGLRTNL
jgi:hypothetical protein